ncbi:DciA family protein [Streptomyces globisporus]|uniref:DciA family protein n=1 Tax=Streptomyces globisporus TaxID=1908 RepID=UPI0037AA3CFE
MTDTAPAEASGVDLARVALRAALAAAKSAPRQRPRRTGASPSRQARSGGREPVALGAAVSRMIAEQGLETGAAGGQVRRTVLSQWDTIAPELQGKVQAVRYDDAARTLHLRPCSPAYRTQLVLHQKEIVARVNAVAGTGTVSCLEILRPGAPDPQVRAEGSPAALAPPPAARPAPDEQTEPRARDPRYLEALAAHQTGSSKAVGRRPTALPHATGPAEPGPATWLGHELCNGSPPNEPPSCEDAVGDLRDVGRQEAPVLVRLDELVEGSLVRVPQPVPVPFSGRSPDGDRPSGPSPSSAPTVGITLLVRPVKTTTATTTGQRPARLRDEFRIFGRSASARSSETPWAASSPTDPSTARY